jgi:hypothetical protein
MAISRSTFIILISSLFVLVFLLAVALMTVEVEWSISFKGLSYTRLSFTGLSFTNIIISLCVAVAVVILVNFEFTCLAIFWLLDAFLNKMLLKGQFCLPLNYSFVFSGHLLTCPTAEIQSREVKRNTNLSKSFPQTSTK